MNRRQTYFFLIKPNVFVLALMCAVITSAVHPIKTALAENIPIPATTIFNPLVNARPAASSNKVLTPGRAIASWPSDVPIGETRPVIVFLPGWGGTGAVNAYVSGQNTNLLNEGYVTLAIGFDSSSEWISDIEAKTLDGLDKLCIDPAIPANCDAIVLVGSSYGGAQNYWVIEHLYANNYDGDPVS
jgi:pimeloyl-ACP methyl ester carboxylesterase